MRFRSRLVVDLNLFAENISQLRSHCSQNEILLMVKANAYGHGLVPIVKFSVEELKIKEFGCATLQEALTIREELKDLEFEVYVFSDVQLDVSDSAHLYLNRRITPVISSLRDLKWVLENKEFAHLPLSLKFNTGMNRLGLESYQVGDVISLLKANGRKTIHHLMSHFASASLFIQKNKQSQRQIEEFAKIKKELTAAGILFEKSSMSNSGAIEQDVGLEETHIRPGLMVYGPSSLIPKYKEKSWWQGKNISALDTYIIKTFPVEKGTPIGYGATPCPDNGIIAVIALGYGDGLSTNYQGATVHHKGFAGIICGKVNMDMAQVLFPSQAEEKLKEGDYIRIWGHDTADVIRLAEETGAITYELFCQLTNRVPRIYSFR